MIDPLDIVNEFMTYPYDVETYPTQESDGYWPKKLCALAERCANAENALKDKENEQ